MADVSNHRVGVVYEAAVGGTARPGAAPGSGSGSGERCRGAERAAGVIGPNAVTQLAGALVDVVGRREAERIFARAGALRLFHDPPGRMVDEAVVQRLYDVVDQSFDADISEWIAYDAGRRTAAYVAKNRIPAIARMVIGMLPPALGARVLLRAIVAHAWTFAGSGRVAARAGETVLIEITDNPLRTRKGQWHRGVLEGLFQALVSGQMQCRHEMLVGEDGPVCRFEIKRRQRGRRPCAAAGA